MSKKGGGGRPHTLSATPSPPGSLCELGGVGYTTYKVPVLGLFEHVPAEKKEEKREGHGAPVQLYHLRLNQLTIPVNCSQPEFPQMVIMRIRRDARTAWYRACPQKGPANVLVPVGSAVKGQAPMKGEHGESVRCCWSHLGGLGLPLVGPLEDR